MFILQALLTSTILTIILQIAFVPRTKRLLAAESTLDSFLGYLHVKQFHVAIVCIAKVVGKHLGGLSKQRLGFCPEACRGTDDVTWSHDSKMKRKYLGCAQRSILMMVYHHPSLHCLPGIQSLVKLQVCTLIHPANNNAVNAIYSYD